MTALLALGWIAVLAVSAARAETPPARASEEAAPAFAAEIEAFLSTLPFERHRFAVRLNRCEGRGNAQRDDIYHVWVGMNGRAPGGDAATILDRIHARWRREGWTVTRYRRLPNGGVNIAAREPATGNAHALDSGFRQDPGGLIAGFFTTPCLRNPSGPVGFGAVR